MITGTLKLAFGALVAALLISSLFAGPNGGAAVSVLRTLIAPHGTSLSPAPERAIAASPPPPQVPSVFGDDVILKPDANGHFHAQVEIEGRPLQMMVDTGASFIVLSNDDAASLGFRPFPSDYRLVAKTANGIVAMAPIILPEVRIGALVERNVQAAVEKRGALSGEGLLGMSFLSKLRGYEVSDGLLILKN
ncbi:MAG TPA: TIGR02281 family clan AA aspartic protease [Beijerinckiaceae bacterium]|nr:TIGR02281 family clan AA aspartic protease [Beijerinckiaceae bacterium]